MNYQIHGYRNGDNETPELIIMDIKYSLSKTNIVAQRGKSRIIKEHILETLRQRGWSSEIALSPHSGITITSQKLSVGLCIQTGNMGRMYADLLKLQTLYIAGKIKTGILIVPTLHSAKLLGQNIANFERLINEMIIFEKVISVPLTIIGME